MTPDQMDVLDRALAEKLMGWTVARIEGCMDTYYRGPDGHSNHYQLKKAYDAIPDGPIWSPTRNLIQALGDGGKGTVVGMMRKREYKFRLDLELKGFSANFYIQKPCKMLGYGYEEINWDGIALIPALAICLAAAKALGIEIEGAH